MTPVRAARTRASTGTSAVGSRAPRRVTPETSDARSASRVAARHHYYSRWVAVECHAPEATGVSLSARSFTPFRWSRDIRKSAGTMASQPQSVNHQGAVTQRDRKW